MEWWQIALVVALLVIVGLIGGVFVVWRLASRRTKRLAQRIGALSWSARVDLARRLFRDERVPIHLRIILPLLVLYLALPLDLVPDFVPVIGQVDDILVLVVGLALLVRFAPTGILDQHLADLEPAIEPPVRKQLGEPRSS